MLRDRTAHCSCVLREALVFQFRPRQHAEGLSNDAELPRYTAVYIPDSVAVATGLYGCIAGDPKGSRHSLALILYALSHSNPLRLDGLKLSLCS